MYTQLAHLGIYKVVYFGTYKATLGPTLLTSGHMRPSHFSTNVYFCADHLSTSKEKEVYLYFLGTSVIVPKNAYMQEFSDKISVEK